MYITLYLVSLSEGDIVNQIIDKNLFCTLFFRNMQFVLTQYNYHVISMEQKHTSYPGACSCQAHIVVTETCYVSSGQGNAMPNITCGDTL